MFLTEGATYHRIQLIDSFNGALDVTSINCFADGDPLLY